MVAERKIIGNFFGLYYSNIAATLCFIFMVAGFIRIFSLLYWSINPSELMDLKFLLPEPPIKVSPEANSAYIVVLIFYCLSCVFFLLTVFRVLVEPKFAAGKPDAKVTNYVRYIILSI